MLWPDDDKKITRFNNIVQYEALLNSSIIALSLESGIEFQGKQLALLLRRVSEGPRLSEVLRKNTKRFLHGLAAGLVVCEIIARRDRGDLAQITETMKAVAKAFSAERCKVSLKTIENSIWPRFRSVAHLWAASARCSGGFSVLPYPLGEVEQFLALAEWYRSAGEEWRPRKSSKGSLLIAERTWRVPSEISLPPPAIEEAFYLRKPLFAAKADFDLSTVE
jgi:hypothetical protein